METLVAGAIAITMACGGTYAQSTGGGNAGNSGSAPGQAGQRQNGAQGTMGGATAGMNGANGANGMNGTTEGCANRVSTAAGNVAEANRPPGSPVQGAASRGSTDWGDQANCANRQGGYGKHSGAGQNPRNGGG
ncbi:hypothetical protein [Frateuria terrea]|uniref:Uncharacterized protein n=1 Tax=Frateuria terrea TaxID=529704 RepID=A0A1H6QIV2_9GAMM|nr:hypothetical protein [Frateuria terrea]SEI43573.1 hypothetical protein SAMN04487997_0645 [Frateuria terrea]SFP08982.1 hypothetical protein SAMN02927913_0561 [Frateuria terrea]